MRLSACLVLGGVAASGLAWILASAEPEQEIAVATTSFRGRLRDQRHNAVLAAKQLDRVVVPPDAVLSFNKTVGSWSRDRGYRKAPVSFSGTLIDAWGGGVCQTSTTLYNAALAGGFEIVERHRHHFVANYVPPGRDAAVAYPAIDLQVRNPYPFPVTVRTSFRNERLTVALVGRGVVPPVSVSTVVAQRREASEYRFGTGPFGRVRNPGKPGFEARTFRSIGEQRQLVSVDSYPAMSRVVERSEFRQ